MLPDTSMLPCLLTKSDLIDRSATMKKLLATAILAPIALNACGRDEDNQASQPSKQIQQLQSQKQGSNQIEELKRL